MASGRMANHRLGCPPEHAVDGSVGRSGTKLFLRETREVQEFCAPACCFTAGTPVFDQAFSCWVCEAIASSVRHVVSRALGFGKERALMADSRKLHGKIELRRAITSSAFTMIALVAVIGLFTLFSIWSINRAWTAGTMETADLQNLSRAALDSQVNFKVQIQEWKNVLLRGDQSTLLEKHLTSFRTHAQRTDDDLGRVSIGATKLGFKDEAQRAADLSNEHATLTARYEAVLAEERGLSISITPDMASLIDKSVRGADRALEAGIGKLSADIAAISDQRRSTLLIDMQDRYSSLRLFILVVIGFSLVITAYVLASALRATRG